MLHNSTTNDYYLNCILQRHNFFMRELILVHSIYY